jgi:hypothetical protein
MSRFVIALIMLMSAQQADAAEWGSTANLPAASVPMERHLCVKNVSNDTMLCPR